MPGVFSTLPASFFSPLASPNRELYADCLLVFYRLFQESPTGVPRSGLVGRFAEIASERGATLPPEGAEDADRRPEIGEDGPADEESPVFGQDAAVGDDARLFLDRSIGTRIVRILVSAGWLGEETLPDYTRVVTISASARPFFEALAKTEEGAGVEYESHVVAIYSSLCGDAAREHGHHAVATAHFHAMLLVESLKVLSQNIRSHYSRLIEESRGAGVPEILRLHYDRYLEEVVDRAYARLKTSDNLSRYRPRIARAVNGFLSDAVWLDRTAAALAAQRRETVEASRLRLRVMLEEIRDQLRALDPVLDDIDRRNMLYARSSIERIKGLLREDASLAGRLASIARVLVRDPGLAASLAHRIERVRWIGKESRFGRWSRAEARPALGSGQVPAELAELVRAEAELRLRVERQLTPERVAAWMDERSGGADRVEAAALVGDLDDLVRLMHATVYAESRPGRFPWGVEWGRGDIESCGWIFRDHAYGRRR